MPTKVIGIAGSLRRGSFNRLLLSAAAASAPETLHISVYQDLAGLPLFNEDDEASAPPAVQQLRDAIGGADAVLIATPEYNQSIPGVLKNAIDWISRGRPSPFDGKTVGIMGATVGMWGTRHAQAALRHTLAACGALVMPTPQLYMARAQSAFGEDAILHDETQQALLTSYLEAFEQWIRKVGVTC